MRDRASSMDVVSLGIVLSDLVIGVFAVVVAPLLNYRNLSRLDIPSTLGVME